MTLLALMIERISAPLAIPTEAKIQALGSITTEGDTRYAPGQAIQEIPPEPSNQTGETFLLGTDTLLTKEAFADGQRRWKAGETMRSEGTPLAEIALHDEEWRILAADTGEFRPIYYGALSIKDEHTKNYREKEGLSDEQAGIIYRVYKDFEAIVNADGERGRLGKADLQETQIFIGYFDPYYEPLGWHTDGGGNPSVRYVVAFGDQLGTQFATGDIQPSDLNQGGYLIGHPKNHKLTITNARPRMATRFIASHGLHCPPNDYGFRLFISMSILPDDGSSLRP